MLCYHRLDCNQMESKDISLRVYPVGDIPITESELNSFLSGTARIATADILQVRVEVARSKSQTEANTTIRTKQLDNN